MFADLLQKIRTIIIDRPDNEKMLVTDFNTLLNVLNNNAPIFITSDADGLITGYSQTIGGVTSNVLSGKLLGSIHELGTSVSYPEYDPDNEITASTFTKAIEDITIMQPGTDNPMVFLPNWPYELKTK